MIQRKRYWKYDLYFNEERDNSEEIQVAMKPFAPSFFNRFCLNLNRKKRVVIRAMRMNLKKQLFANSSKQVFLKLLQTSQENTCVGISFNKLYQKLNLIINFIKKKLQHRYFLAKFAKFLRSTFFTENLRWLLLKLNIFILQLLT